VCRGVEDKDRRDRNVHIALESREEGAGPPVFLEQDLDLRAGQGKQHGLEDRTHEGNDKNDTDCGNE
jgi:hypothetical protein